MKSEDEEIREPECFLLGVGLAPLILLLFFSAGAAPGVSHHLSAL